MFKFDNFSFGSHFKLVLLWTLKDMTVSWQQQDAPGPTMTI